MRHWFEAVMKVEPKSSSIRQEFHFDQLSSSPGALWTCTAILCL